MSDKSLSRFRKRCYEYERETGRDLIHECIAKLRHRTADLMGITQRVIRMDSMMIEANIRKLTRSELIYSCGAIMVIRCHKDGRDDLIAGMEHYYDLDDFNRCFYHATGEGSRSEPACQAARSFAHSYAVSSLRDSAILHAKRVGSLGQAKLLAGKGACENHPQRRRQAS